MRIDFIGDVMLGRLVNKALKTKTARYPWGDTLPILEHADLRICNLECVLSDIGTPWSLTPKAFHFRTDEKNIHTLLAAQIDMVSLANNHVLDYDYAGLFRMMEVLRKNNIHYAGVGMDFSEAAEPSIRRVGTHTVGLIACTDNEPDWEAKEQKPGVLYVPIDEADVRAKYLFTLCRKTRDDVDTLIVSLHWGPNWGYTPLPEQVAFAHRLIDEGVDFVYGHSPHIFRGIEFYKGKVIFYSTGDFIDDYAIDEIERNDESCIFRARTDPGRNIQVTLYPTIITQFQARQATAQKRAHIISTMQGLCESLSTHAQWNEQEECLTVEPSRRDATAGPS